jgi:hypothetical protein
MPCYCCFSSAAVTIFLSKRSFFSGMLFIYRLTVLFVSLSFYFLVLLSHFPSNSFLNGLAVRISLRVLLLFLEVGLCRLPSGSGDVLFATSTICYRLLVDGERMSVSSASEREISTSERFGISLTCEDGKLISLNTFKSLIKPFFTLSWTLLQQDCYIPYSLILKPGFLLIHNEQALGCAPLNGFMKVLYKGRNLWAVCGRMLSKCTLLFRAKLLTRTSLWLP